MMKNFFIFLWILSVLCFVSITTSSGEDFVYSDAGRRDPFWPLVSPSGAILTYDQELQFADLVLEGIIYESQGEALAIINSRVVRPQDVVGGFTVHAIHAQTVVLWREGKEFILNLKKE